MTAPSALTLRGRGRGNDRLGVGPRHRTPITDDVVMSVFHRTTRGGGSVLLEVADVERLALWLQLGTDTGPWELIGAQTTARIAWDDDDGRWSVRIQWRGSGQGSTVHLLSADAVSLREWLTDWLATSWTPALLARRGQVRA